MLADVANPCEPAPLLMVATDVVSELHRAAVVTSCVVLSVMVAVAVNCFVRPFATLGFVGEIAKDATVAAVTFKFVLPLTPFKVALITVVPWFVDVARPLLPPTLLMEAIKLSSTPSELLSDFHVTEVVISCVVPSV